MYISFFSNSSKVYCLDCSFHVSLLLKIGKTPSGIQLIALSTSIVSEHFLKPPAELQIQSNNCINDFSGKSLNIESLWKIQFICYDLFKQFQITRETIEISLRITYTHILQNNQVLLNSSIVDDSTIFFQYIFEIDGARAKRCWVNFYDFPFTFPKWLKTAHISIDETNFQFWLIDFSFEFLSLRNFDKF